MIVNNVAKRQSKTLEHFYSCRLAEKHFFCPPACFVCMQSNTQPAYCTMCYGADAYWSGNHKDEHYVCTSHTLIHTVGERYGQKYADMQCRSINTCKLAGLPVCLWFATPISYEKMRQSCNYGRSIDCHNPSPLTGQNMAGFQGNQSQWGCCQRAHGCAWGQSLARLYDKVTGNRRGLGQTKFNGVRGGQTILRMWTEN